MIRNTFLLAAAALAIGVAGCGSKADAGAAGADVSQYTAGQKPSGDDDLPSAEGPSKAIAAIDPCALVTKQEIVAQIEASMERTWLEAFHAKGGTWDIASTPATAGIAKECDYSWRGKASNGEVFSTTDFKVVVTDGALVSGDINKAKTRPIPGVGDEAYFMSRGPMMPYARVGKVGIGIEGFPSTPTAKAGADLLRTAVSRVRAP